MGIGDRGKGEKGKRGEGEKGKGGKGEKRKRGKGKGGIGEKGLSMRVDESMNKLRGQNTTTTIDTNGDKCL